MLAVLHHQTPAALRECTRREVAHLWQIAAARLEAQ